MRVNRYSFNLKGKTLDKNIVHQFIISEKGKNNYCVIYWIFELEQLKEGVLGQYMYIGFYDNGDEKSDKLKEGITFLENSKYERKLIKGTFEWGLSGYVEGRLKLFETSVDRFLPDEFIKPSDKPDWKEYNDEEYYLLEGIRREYGLPLFSMVRNELIGIDTKSNREGKKLSSAEWDDVYYSTYKELENEESFKGYIEKVYPYLDELVQNWINNNNVMSKDIMNFFTMEFSCFNSVLMGLRVYDYDRIAALYKKDDWVLSRGGKNDYLSDDDKIELKWWRQGHAFYVSATGNPFEPKIKRIEETKMFENGFEWLSGDAAITIHTEDIYSLIEELDSSSPTKSDKIEYYIPRYILYKNIEYYLEKNSYALISCLNYEGDLFKYFFPDEEYKVIELIKVPNTIINRYIETGFYFIIPDDIMQQFRLRYAKHVLMCPNLKQEGLKYLLEFDDDFTVTKLECFK